MAQINITINTVDDLSPKDVLNTIRRATANITEFAEGETVENKGVTFRVRKAPKSVTVETLAPVRSWAAKKGISLGKRGRIPASVMAAFNAAQTK